MQFSIWKFALPGLILVFCWPLAAEEPGLPEKPEISNLHRLATRSGYVFAGTVKAVERIAPRSKDGVAVMRITFHVEHGYRGVRTGQTISIHEWAGLWEAGERYRRGERVVLFLYPPSKLGLTSPVEGPSGRLVIDSGGQIVVPSSPPPSTSSPAPAQLPQGFRISPQDFARALRLAEQE